MIDIHTHILPGLDDGSQTLSDSLEMAELALESGVDTIIATPHSNQLGRFENFALVHLKHVFSRLQQALQEEGIILGKFGRHAQIAADYLLRYRLATCIASDAHSPVMRTTHMRDIIEYLLETYGEREMLRLLFENPDRMIYDRDIPHHGSLPERRRGLFF